MNKMFVTSECETAAKAGEELEFAINMLCKLKGVPVETTKILSFQIIVLLRSSAEAMKLSTPFFVATALVEFTLEIGQEWK